MFEAFERSFSLTSRTGDGSHSTSPGPLDSLVSKFGGATFNDGLYRMHDTSSAKIASGRVGIAFPEFEGITCFGFDWLGREFAVDLRDSIQTNPKVLMLEPGTGEVLEIPVSLSEFHDSELVEFGQAALAISFFDEWISRTKVILDFNQCAGYRVPLFLSGADAIENIEVVDIDVYWSITTQLRLGVKNLPDGAKVERVEGS